MTVKIELSPEVEAGLAAQAQALGMDLPQYLGTLLRNQSSLPVSTGRTPKERAAGLRAMMASFPRTPLLSDEAISRENLYSDRG